MGLWSQGIKRSKTGLDIENGVLIDYNSPNPEVKIPAEVERVAYNAFVGHEDVKLDISESHLAGYIASSMKLVEHSHDNRTKPYVQFEEYGPCMPIFKMNSESIDAAVKEALKIKAKKSPETAWKIITVDADDINCINQQIEEIGRDNLITVVGDEVKTFHDLPFISSSPIQQIGTGIDTINHLIDKEGFGVIILKNLNENNYKQLPHNFIYNLTKNQSFCKVRISPKWIVLIEVGPNVRLDAPGGTSYSFNANPYKNISTEEYMKKMRKDGKVITKIELWDAFFKTER